MPTYLRLFWLPHTGYLPAYYTTRARAALPARCTYGTYAVQRTPAHTTTYPSLRSSTYALQHAFYARLRSTHVRTGLHTVLPLLATYAVGCTGWRLHYHTFRLAAYHLTLPPHGWTSSYAPLPCRFCYWFCHCCQVTTTGWFPFRFMVTAHLPWIAYLPPPAASSPGSRSYTRLPHLTRFRCTARVTAHLPACFFRSATVLGSILQHYTGLAIPSPPSYAHLPTPHTVRLRSSSCRLFVYFSCLPRLPCPHTRALTCRVRAFTHTHRATLTTFLTHRCAVPHTCLPIHSSGLPLPAYGGLALPGFGWFVPQFATVHHICHLLQLDLRDTTGSACAGRSRIATSCLPCLVTPPACPACGYAPVGHWRFWTDGYLLPPVVPAPHSVLPLLPIPLPLDG